MSKNWWKLLWHCLIKFHRNFYNEDHRMCSIKYRYRDNPRKDFCSCGYLNDGVTWEDLKKKNNWGS